jgi:hypothetical protein
MASRLQDVHLRTTTALKPLATAVAEGTLHYDTDTGLITRSNKIVWETYSVAGGGTGDVVGPAVAVDSDIALFDGITGKLLKDSGLTIAQLVAMMGMVLIEEKTPVGVNTVTFASLGAYTHLKLIISARCDAAAVSTGILLFFNADLAANYDRQILSGTGAGASASEALAHNTQGIMLVAGATASAGMVGTAEILIPDYRGTVNQKMATATNSIKTSNAGGALTTRQTLNSWRNVAAITSLVVNLGAGINYVAPTKMSLYGLK